MCCKGSYRQHELRRASHSCSSRRFDRQTAPALLPPSLVDAIGAQQASCCQKSTGHLRSEHTSGSDADWLCEAISACLEERRSRTRSWRQPSSQVSIPPVASIPQPSEHICCEVSAMRTSFDTGSSTQHAEGRGRQESVGTASLILRRGAAKCSLVYRLHPPPWPVGRRPSTLLRRARTAVAAAPRGPC